MSGSRCLARVSSSPSPPPFPFSPPFFSSLFLFCWASRRFALVKVCVGVRSFRWGGRACVAWAFGGAVGLGWSGFAWPVGVLGRSGLSLGVLVPLLSWWRLLSPLAVGGSVLGASGVGIARASCHVLRRRAVANEGMNCAVDLAFVRFNRTGVH
jgi:hypothetical protein